MLNSAVNAEICYCYLVKKLPYVVRYLVLNKVIFDKTPPPNRRRSWIVKNEINAAASIRVNMVMVVKKTRNFLDQ